MKLIKKISKVLVIIAISIGFTACGSNTPTSEVENVLKGLAEGKRNEVNDMVTKAINKSIFGGEEELSKEVQGGMTEDTQQYLNEIMKKMKFKINSEKIDGEKASVNVTVNGGNISKAFNGYLGDLLTLAYTSDVLSTTPPEEYFLLVNSILYEKLKVIEFDERTLDINLLKKGQQWEIEKDAAFYELLLGTTGQETTK